MDRVVKDEWNPTAEELSAWAFEAGAMWPTEDWDLAVTTDDRSALILRLATDPTCPTRNFFLRCLYLLVGDAVRSDFVAHRREIVLELLARVPADCPPDVLRWANRAQELVAGPPDAVDHSLWCDGGYSRAERDAD
jgi:hypothetical protein